MKNKNLLSLLTPTILTTCVLMTIFTSSCDREDPITIVPQVISCTDINTATTWADRGEGVDYTVNCIISVEEKLTIAPGVVIEFKNGGGLSVQTNGALIASGTSAKPIVLKGDVNVAGVWRGIFVRSNNVLNELNYCQISNGGSASFDGNSTKLANIRLALSSKLKMTNCTVASSAKDGLYIDGFDFDELNPITAFNNNSFTGNLNYPISALGATANVLDAASTFTGNTNNKVLLRGGRLFGNHTWKKLTVPYLIESIVSAGYSGNSGNLTIEPGTIVQFAGDAGLCTGEYSTSSWMNITGTPTQRITLTGETAAPGAWKGIAFQSTSPNNVIAYLDISYGGSSSYTGNNTTRGNIIAGAWSAGDFSISNSTINNSEAWGIFATGPSPIITYPSSVTFSGNASGDYFHD